MISVTKINNQPIVINSELIEYIEQTPDTTITMTTGRKILVRESVDEVIVKVIDFKRKIYAFPKDN